MIRLTRGEGRAEPEPHRDRRLPGSDGPSLHLVTPLGHGGADCYRLLHTSACKASRLRRSQSASRASSSETFDPQAPAGVEHPLDRRPGAGRVQSVGVLGQLLEPVGVEDDVVRAGGDRRQVPVPGAAERQAEVQCLGAGPALGALAPARSPRG